MKTWDYYYQEQRRRFEIQENKASNESDAHTSDSAYMFDAIWAATLALNRTKSRLDKKNLNFMDFNYENDTHNISGMIYEEALNVNFFGLTVSEHINNVAE